MRGQYPVVSSQLPVPSSLLARRMAGVLGAFAIFRQLSGSIMCERVFPLVQRMKQRGMILWLALLGGASFWLPDVAVHIVAGRGFDSPHVRVITFLMPATFLIAYLIARRFLAKRSFKWVGAAMLLGVWLTGGVFMTAAATASQGGFAGPGGVRGGLLMIALSIVPLVTFMMATYDGSLGALIAVTIGALLICIPNPFDRCQND